MNEYLSLASIILPEEWSRALHAEEWLVFPENMGPHYVLMGLASPRARSIPSYPTSPIYVPKTKVRQLVALLYLRDKNVRRISSCPTDFVVKYTISDSTFKIRRQSSYNAVIIPTFNLAIMKHLP